jgi:centrosomal protein CEP120
LETTEHAKERYKAQWSRALSEIAALKRRHQLDSKESIRREQKELRHMRMKYLMREESEVSADDRAELGAIKEELARLRMAAEHHSQYGSNEGGTGSRTGGGGGGGGVHMSGDEQAANEAIQRLVQERSSLLQSGVYGEQIIPVQYAPTCAPKR